ncbi:MAG: efflux RND transporter permease subunit [Elusimicrobia bacterium]|nr:efflux RND transporter permease subunit [Elusimicrobiota bacterium]
MDDAIVVVENIHRHFAMKDGRSTWRLSVDAAAEVGELTILATWAVIAAILPMAFVSGPMGPLGRSPWGASVPCRLLGIAFCHQPLGLRAYFGMVETLRTRGPTAPGESALDRLYCRFMGRLLSDAKARWSYLGGMVVLLLASLGSFTQGRDGQDAAFRQQKRVRSGADPARGQRRAAHTKAAADDIARVL